MSNHEHRPGVHEAFLVKRHLKLRDTAEQAMTAAAERLMELRGMDKVTTDSSRQKLHLAYDASVLHLDRILELLRETGCALPEGRWRRFRRNWYRSGDTNVAANARKEPWNCH